MHKTLDQTLTDLAASRHGIFSTSDVHRVGFTPKQRRTRLEAGRWIRLHDGVYRIAGAPSTWKGTLLGACLAGGPTAGASHRSGASVWQIDGGDTSIAEIVCRRWNRSFESGLIIHETKALDQRDLTIIDSIPVTTIERTLLDLGAVRHPLTIERAVETALRRELTTLPDLRATVRRLGRSGRNGVGVLRKILDERDPQRRLTESAMEMRMFQVLRANGLPLPIVQYEIRYQGRFIARVDAAYPDLRIALEYESFEWHLGKQAHIRDNARRNAIVASDWRPIAVTWEDLRTGGHTVCDDIRRTRNLAA